jgi:hypothetical protein
MLVAVLPLSCVVPADPPVDTLSFENCAQSDTIAPYGEIRIAFSMPADDSAVPRFDFSPPFFSYAVTLNAPRDTALLELSEPLAGARRYVVRIDEFVAEPGRYMSSDDSVVIITRPTEREPNNTPQTADTLATVRWGAIATINDTDWYTAACLPGEALVLTSALSQTSFAVIGRSGAPGPERTFRTSDTLRITDTLPVPLQVAVFAYHRSVGGHYELRLVPSE